MGFAHLTFRKRVVFLVAVNPAGESLMDIDKLEGKLNELVTEISGLDRKSEVDIRELASQAQKKHEKLKQTVDNLQDSLDYLRICIKYQLLDLEATKRENRYLRKLLD
jgi:uncharacterized protein YlxW (UPF0749 family)